MKRITIPYSIFTAPTIRRYAASACAALLLAACTNDDALSGADSEHHSNTPVTFNARVQATPATRTAIGANGQTVWADGDAVSVFMLEAGEAMPDGILTGADNVKYNVAVSGALSPAGTPIYYPLTGKVDFIALYPYSNKETGNGKITDDYRYAISVADQTNPEAIDVLYAKASGVEKSSNPVNLSFDHVLSKIQLNITLGDGLDNFTNADITQTIISGMPTSATLLLNDGTLTASTIENITAIKSSTSSQNAVATFTALIVPQAENSYTGRKIFITVDGVEYSGSIPDGDFYEANKIYVYPVTVQRTRIDVGKPSIIDWVTNPHDSGIAEYIYTITYNANGGSGTVPAPEEVVHGAYVTLPDATGLIPPKGKAFAGWSSTSGDNSVDQMAGSSYSPDKNITLYAVWTNIGESEDFPILIYDSDGLAKMQEGLDKCYQLMSDITVDEWVPIGTKDRPFKGSFNGQGHTITINSFQSLEYKFGGLFGMGEEFTIRQICVAGPSDDFLLGYGDGAFGGIMGRANGNFLIENCLVTANLMVEKATRLGGIIGEHDSGLDSKVGIIKNCLVTGKLYNKCTNPSAFISTFGIGGLGYLTCVNCVVLSAEIEMEDEDSNMYSIGGFLNVSKNNYANENMQPSDKLNTVYSQPCKAKPTLEWWKSDIWDTNYGAFDFEKIWDMGVNDYPCLRAQK